MQARVAVSLALLAFVAGADAVAAGTSLPAIKASQSNPVPACATPGRLMALIKSRTPDLDKRYESVAAEYRRHGEELGMRWDYAFYQMIVETGGLSFKNGNRSGSVKPSQNNFAGLGATGGDAGESFPDVSTGVRAHLEHLLIYAGERVEKPTAERTRKVQEWGILKKWQAGIKGPITFDEISQHWANSRAYGTQIEGVAARFNDEHCNKPDPQPEAIAATEPKTEPKIEKGERPQKISGADLAKKAIEDGKTAEIDQRSGLGAGTATKPALGIKILNAPSTETAEAFDQPSPAQPTTAQKASVASVPPVANKPTDKPATKVAAAAAGAAAAAKAPTAKAADTAQPGKCRVWTASYGGSRAMIIKAPGTDGFTNYTVLDVNEGQESREADAYISAYASGGSVAGEFPTQNQALDKAFELCPEG